MTELWTGEFGDDYTRRHQNRDDADLNARKNILRMLLPRYLESILEVGANVGRNLEAMAEFSPCTLYATEPNDMARAQLKLLDCIQPDHVSRDYAHKLNFPDGLADLVMTMGVLIHVRGDLLLPSMREIHRVSRRYVLCGEYFAPSEEAVSYRGQDDALWRRDYGSLWLDNFPDLTCRTCTFAWKRMTGLDNITFWLFEK